MANHTLSGKVALVSFNPVAATDPENDNPVLVDFSGATDWTLNFGSPPEAFFAIAGLGFQQTVATAFRGEGTFNFVVQRRDDAPSIRSGMLVYLQFLADDFVGAGNMGAFGNARLGQFNYTPSRDGAPQKFSIPFMTDGPWFGNLFGSLTPEETEPTVLSFGNVL